MTTELRSCNWCGMSEQTCGDEACPQKHDTRNRTTSILEAVAEHPADPLAGLVRWRHCEYPNQHKVMEHKDGEYVRHSEAVKIAINLKQDADAWRLNCKGWQDEAKAAEAELAQIKAQEPICYVDVSGMAAIGMGGVSTVHTQFESHKSDRFCHPLYAAPVSDSLNAENERLRKALKTIADETESGDYYLVKDLARTTLNVEASNDKT